jgi:hypothetical protein
VGQLAPLRRVLRALLLLQVRHRRLLPALPHLLIRMSHFYLGALAFFITQVVVLLCVCSVCNDA